MIDTVIFDMDGVLFDTERLYRDCFIKTAQKHRLADPETVVFQCVGLDGETTKAMLEQHYGAQISAVQLKKETADLFYQTIDENGIPEKPGLHALLSYLKQNHYHIGLASSSRLYSVNRHLNSAGIAGYFDVVVASESVTRCKPDPEPYAKACEMLGVSPESSVAVEDSPTGILSASRAGLKPVFVPDLIKPDEQTRKLIFRECADLNAVLTLLEEYR